MQKLHGVRGNERARWLDVQERFRVEIDRCGHDYFAVVISYYLDGYGVTKIRIRKPRPSRDFFQNWNISRAEWARDHRTGGNPVPRNGITPGP